MKVYVDVSCYMKTDFVSGIQRVVREVLRRLKDCKDFELVTLKYDGKCKLYRMIDAKCVIDRKNRGKGKKLNICDMEKGDIFFEIDGCWDVSPQRSLLYRKLKEQGIGIVAVIHDVLTITHPDFFGNLGNWAFLGYLGACLNYADKIIVTTHAVEKSIRDLIERVKNEAERCEEFDLPLGAIEVIGLGGDLQNPAQTEEIGVDSEVKKFVNKYAGEYVLMVGTIEPRKNHSVILDAFEHKLLQKGISLVIAGRVGWDSDKVMHRIRIAQENPSFLFAEGKTSSTIRYLYKHAKAVVFPSFDEGYGLPIIEAMSYGVPVIAGDVPVLREVGKDACLYCDVNDSTAWENTILRLYEDSDFYRIMKEKAENFKPQTWDETTKLICKSLIELSHS